MLSSTLYSDLPIPFMKGVNMANDSVMCLSCLKLVPEDSQAICNVICVTGGPTLSVWGSPKQLTN